MRSILDFLCDARSFLILILRLYFHDLCLAVSDIDFMISLLCSYILCMVRQSALVYLYLFQCLNVCSSMMSVHPKGVGAPRGILEYRLLI